MTVKLKLSDKISEMPDRFNFLLWMFTKVCLKNDTRVLEGYYEGWRKGIVGKEFRADLEVQLPDSKRKLKQ